MKKTIALFTFLFSANSFAVDGRALSEVNIKNLIFWSNQEPIAPEWAGMISIASQEPITWSNNSSCHNETVAIRAEDKHIISAVLAAKMAGKAVLLYADDAYKIQSKYCIVRAVTLI